MARNLVPEAVYITGGTATNTFTPVTTLCPDLPERCREFQLQNRDIVPIYLATIVVNSSDGSPTAPTDFTKALKILGESTTAGGYELIRCDQRAIIMDNVYVACNPADDTAPTACAFSICAAQL